MAAWSYRTGQKGLNRVRAFEQDRRFYIEWYEGERRRRERVALNNRKDVAQRAVEKSRDVVLSGVKAELPRRLGLDVLRLVEDEAAVVRDHATANGDI